MEQRPRWSPILTSSKASNRAGCHFLSTVVLALDGNSAQSKTILTPATCSGAHSDRSKRDRLFDVAQLSKGLVRSLLGNLDIHVFLQSDPAVPHVASFRFTRLNQPDLEPISGSHRVANARLDDLVFSLMLRYLQLLTQGTDAANSGTARHHRNRGESDTTTEQASSHARALEDRLTSETHLRRFTETVLDSRQQEIEDREMEKDELVLRVETLEKQLASTQQQLEEAQDQVFRLQPSRKDITESEAKDAYKTLVANVQRWVENRAGHIIDELENGRLTSRPAPPEGSRLVTLLREQSRRCINVSQSDEFQIMGAIMNYLHITMFSKSFYCPLDDSDDGGTAAWIDELENTMSRLQRDITQCREWRSETLTALTHQPAFKARRQRYINFVVDDLTSLLSIIVPRTPPADLQASVRRSIVEPAADLVHQLHLAPSIYSLKWPARSASTRLEVYQCFNLASGGTLLDLSGTKSSSPARRNVMYLFDIAPGLFIERIDEGKKLGLKAIVKPTVLVTNAGEDISQGPTVMRWLWDGIPSPQGPSRSASRASSARRPAGSVISSSGRWRY